MKLMLCSRRNPAMNRTQFFDHLQNVHAPLVKGLPEIMKYLRKYVQNHTRLPEDCVTANTAFRHALERDSVIELWFDDKQSLLQSLGEPKYQAIVRPDEAFFNDFSVLIMLATKEVPMWSSSGGAGNYKSFDFIKRRAGIDHQTFLAHWERHAALLAGASAYQSIVQKSSRNLALSQEDNPFGAMAAYDGVVETWLAGFEDAEKLSQFRLGNREVMESEAKFIDTENSFSVLAEQFSMVG